MARANIIAAVIFGTLLYAFFTWVWAPFHYIHMMCITLFAGVGFALTLNRFAFGQTAEFLFGRSGKRFEEQTA